MNFDWTPEQLALRDKVRQFSSEHLGKDLAVRDVRGAMDESDWREDFRKCGQFRILGCCVPVEYGGEGHDALTTVLVLEAVGYGCGDNGLTLGLNGQIWAVQEPILAFGSEAQKRRYLPGLCNGDLIGAHGMTEPQSGSDAGSLASTAERVEGGYLLNGHKTYVGLAPSCDMAIVFASTNPSRKQWGVSAFLVDASRPGFQRSPPQMKMGLRTAPMGDILLENCFVPEDSLLGVEGAGMAIFQHSMEWERGFIFASHVGAMERQLEQCVAFAKSRVVFGQKIEAFQSISNRLADMKLRLETAKLLLYRVAWLKSHHAPAPMDAALAKLHISEAFVANSLDAIRIHGGRGYVTEGGVERDLRDSVGGLIYSGTSDIQRQIIARLLGE